VFYSGRLAVPLLKHESEGTPRFLFVRDVVSFGWVRARGLVGNVRKKYFKV
jgi:hypothetical protein